MTIIDRPVVDQRTGPGRRSTDRRRALDDWGNDLAAEVHAALEARAEIGYELAFHALVVGALRIAKDLGITDAEGRHE